jgi:hypothetical protein
MIAGETGGIKDKRFLFFQKKEKKKKRKERGNKKTKKWTLYEWVSQTVPSSRVSV